MELIERIHESFKKGESFYFTASDILVLNNALDQVSTYEKALKTINYLSPLQDQLVDAQYIALLALKTL